jgi:hypothetical protein
MTDSPWEAGIAKQAESSREEQRKALTALVIRTLGSGICEMLGDKRAGPEYWHEATQVLARVLGGMPEDVKVKFYQSVVSVFIEQLELGHPAITAEVDSLMAAWRERKRL